MSAPHATPPLLAILGPTASGKSSLAIHLARQFHGEVLACDSTQLYRGFDVGTGKPTHAERHGIPHHLLDILDRDQEATAGGYREMAITVLDDLRTRDQLPILTVGTGLYMRALFDGLAELPLRSEEVRRRLRAGMEKHGPGHLHKILQRLDPLSASRIAPADTQKLIRAVEVCLLTRRPLTEVHSQGRNPLKGWQIIKIGLDPAREALYARIHARIDAMLAGGWQKEVEALLADRQPERGPVKPFDFLGYRELAAVARGELSLDAARAAIQQSTRRYAKRQQTWFRREENVTWFPSFGDNHEAQQHVAHWLAQIFAGKPPR